MRDKAPETYGERAAQLEEIRQEAVHAGSDAAIAKQLKDAVLPRK